MLYVVCGEADAIQNKGRVTKALNARQKRSGSNIFAVKGSYLTSWRAGLALADHEDHLASRSWHVLWRGQHLFAEFISEWRGSLIMNLPKFVFVLQFISFVRLGHGIVHQGNILVYLQNQFLLMYRSIHVTTLTNYSLHLYRAHASLNI